jgi:Divergent InlB B-repeat domain
VKLRVSLASFACQGRLSAPPLGETGRAWRRARYRSAPWIAAAIAALILLASVPQAQVGAPSQGHRSVDGLPLSPTGTVFHPASMAVSDSPGGATAQSSFIPTYDEQIGATFTQNFSALAYNVTALAQADPLGYGPAYLLNGLTDAGYWYQAGISFHWPDTNGSYYPTFAFSYQVYGPSGKSVFPLNGSGLAAFSKIVLTGDSVLLSLTFTGPTVQMLAKDWTTGATAEANFSSEGSSTFVGNPSSPNDAHGFFSGLMTEWYHAALYSGNEGQVTYTNEAVGLSSAWMWIDEFNGGSQGPPLFDNQTQRPVTFANDQQVYPFAADGATMYISAHRFVTGLSVVESASRVTLTPAATETSSRTFSANYTLAGQAQTAVIAAGATVLEADPGTSITVSINSSGSSALERWVFSGTSGSEVTFAAGTNATYVYYHLVRETVSYQVASGGRALPASSALVLTYEAPPSVASSKPVPVAATQVLGTAPAVIFALLGSDASINGTVPGAAGERWASSTQSWTVSAPDGIPDPIKLYQQYNVSVGYSVVGGGTPSQTPEFNSTAFGNPAAIQLSGTETTGWFDAGSGYSFTRFLNGSIPTERWQQIGGGVSANNSGQGNRLQGELIGIFAPDETVTGDYVHQYYTDLGVNDPHGGNIFGSFSGTIDNGSVTGHVAPGPGWTDAGLSLDLTASANQGWQFENWTGSGVGTYTGTSPSISVVVSGPLSENATFYVKLAIAADAGTNIAFSYSSGAGTVQAGTTKTIYVPPSSSVTLRAAPSLFVYSFASWKGTGIASSTKPSLALVVDSPSAVTGTSTYNLPVVLGAAFAAAIIILAVSLLIRDRRRRERLGVSIPSSSTPSAGDAAPRA